MRRCAKAFGLGVETLSPEDATPEAVRAAIGGGRAAGCVVECWMARHVLPPRLFGSVPVVYFDPPQRRGWSGVRKVACDDEAVARSAFGELAKGLPPCYAAVAGGDLPTNPWARTRIAAFQKCCRHAGKPCAVFRDRGGETAAAREARLFRWVSDLPHHCAVFAVNDSVAAAVARIMAAAGRSIPRTASLVGVDDAAAPDDGQPASDISSVKVDFEFSGYLAAKMVAGTAGVTCGTCVTGECRFRHKCSPRPHALSALSASPAGRTSTVATFGPLFVERRASTRGFGRREPFVMAALETIRREACDGLGAADLAARFPVSRKLFELRFREAMGHSALDEILHVRMARVFDLLSRPEVPIGAIADFCGFDSGRELRDIFRQRTGTSLSRWRKARC